MPTVGPARWWGFIPLIQHTGSRGRQISEFKVSLVYRVSSRTARAIQRNPVSKKQQKTKNKQKNKKTTKKTNKTNQTTTTNTPASFIRILGLHTCSTITGVFFSNFVWETGD
jgi:predicted S18 family serine protease